MPAFKLAILNEAQIPGAEVDAFVDGARQWVSQLLEPHWPEVAGTAIRAVPSGESPASDEAWIVLAPNTTMANTLGYHQWTDSGLPTGIVELDSCRESNVPWTVPATHEIGELLINPRLDQYVAIGNLWYPKELCDPVTSDRLQVGTMWAANAVTPAWFDRMAAATSRFDLLGNVHTPIPTIPKGGWVEWWDGSDWQSDWGAEMSPEMVTYMKRRRGRRYVMHLGHEKWQYGRARKLP